ncbi:MAG: hypothetical protein DWQ06_07120 [Calditrichaeota bacterium]|nr:MAG: hypothetical protein DWQ06_07120 [Calditrichota bacterium]
MKNEFERESQKIVDELRLSKHLKLKTDLNFQESTKRLLILDFIDLYYKPRSKFKIALVSTQAVLVSILFYIVFFAQTESEETILKNSIWLFDNGKIGTSYTQVDFFIREFDPIYDEGFMVSNSTKGFYLDVKQDTENPKKFEKVVYKSNKLYSFNLSDGEGKNWLYNSDYFYYPYSALSQKEFFEFNSLDPKNLNELSSLNRNAILLVHSFLNDIKHKYFAAELIVDAIITGKVFDFVENREKLVTQVSLRGGKTKLDFHWKLNSDNRIKNLTVWGSFDDLKLKIFEMNLENRILKEKLEPNFAVGLVQELEKHSFKNLQELAEVNRLKVSNSFGNFSFAETYEKALAK